MCYSDIWFAEGFPIQCLSSQPEREYFSCFLDKEIDNLLKAIQPGKEMEPDEDQFKPQQCNFQTNMDYFVNFSAPQFPYLQNGHKCPPFQSVNIKRKKIGRRKSCGAWPKAHAQLISYFLPPSIISPILPLALPFSMLVFKFKDWDCEKQCTVHDSEQVV